MKQPTTWIVLADGAVAKIYEYQGRNADPVALPKENLEAPPQPEFGDEQGVSKSRMSASVHRMAPRTGPDPLLSDFAAEIVARLDDAVRRGKCERIVLAAGPKLLGLIRQAMDDALAAAVCAELDKDLTHFTTRELRDYMVDKVPTVV